MTGRTTRRARKVQPDPRRTCVDCEKVTDAWVLGWDDKYRCMEHAPNGALNMMANHCPSCTCVKRNPSLSGS